MYVCVLDFFLFSGWWPNEMLNLDSISRANSAPIYFVYNSNYVFWWWFFFFTHILSLSFSFLYFLSFFGFMCCYDSRLVYYLCLMGLCAAETVPPSVKAVNHVVGAPVESHVLLECIVEVFPKPLNGFYFNEGKQDIMPTNFYRLFSVIFFGFFLLLLVFRYFFFLFSFFGSRFFYAFFLQFQACCRYMFTTCRLSLYHFEPIILYIHKLWLTEWCEST